MTNLDGLPDDPSGLRDAALAMRAELAAERALRQRLEDQTRNNVWAEHRLPVGGGTEASFVNRLFGVYT